jgi:hypothetical protein
MAKQLQKTTSKSLKLNILRSILDDNKLPENISKSKLNYHLKPFIVNKLVERVGYGVWRLTKLGKATLDLKQLQILSLDTSFVIGNLKFSKIRGHGFMWKLKLPKKAWFPLNKRKSLLRDYSELQNKTIKLLINNNIVHLGLRTIVVYFNKNKSYIGRSAKDSYKLALYDFEQVLRKLENIYNCSLRIRKHYRFKVCKNHYGHLNNEFAVHYKEHGKSLIVRDEGKEWLSLDFSQKRFIEAETIDSERAKYDMDNIIVPTMNTLRHDPYLLKTLKKENEEIKLILKDTQDALKVLLEERRTSFNIDRFKY